MCITSLILRPTTVTITVHLTKDTSITLPHQPATTTATLHSTCTRSARTSIPTLHPISYPSLTIFYCESHKAPAHHHECTPSQLLPTNKDFQLLLNGLSFIPTPNMPAHIFNITLQQFKRQHDYILQEHLRQL